MDDDVVRSAPLFAALDDEAAKALAASMSPQDVRRGSSSSPRATPATACTSSRSGKIKLVRSSVDGRENLLAVLGPGEMFGELSLFDPGPRTATARAVADRRLIGLGHEDMMRWLAGRPEVAGHLLRRWPSGCAAPTRPSPTSSSPTSPAGSPRRCSTWPPLRRARSTTACCVAHDLTQEELAQLVGASRETVNKALADFASRGWLRLEARAVVLHDVERLRRRAR